MIGKRSNVSNGSPWDPEYILDLETIFKGEIPDSNSFKESFAQAIIDKIVERTQSNEDVRGRNFEPYSESYKNSAMFKGFGKSNTVDLTLTGDMLGFLDLVKTEGSKIILGWNDPNEAAKAHGHITGGATGKKRDFFGVSKAEVDEIKQDFMPIVREFRKASKEERENIIDLINQDNNLDDLIDDLLGDVEVD
jgi:hypothetical protein